MSEPNFFPKVDYFPTNINQFTQQHTESGGTNSTFFLKENGITKFVLKRANSIDQFKEEILAEAIYQTISDADPSFGIHIPKFQSRNDNGQFSRISEFLPGKELGFQKIDEVAKGFVVDAFMANWDLVVGGKNLWLSKGNIYRMDNGGSLRYRALGELKSTLGYKFNQAVSDLYTLRRITDPSNSHLTANHDGSKFYGHLTQAEILSQIAKLVVLQEQILNTADICHAWLNINDFATLRSNLITRLESLKTFYYDQVHPVLRYEQAHPLSVVIPNKSSASILMVADHMGHKKVLLGKRVRHKWWGNFGGKADDEDKTLCNAAAREVNEESMGLYHIMADNLIDTPFHDLIKGGNQPDALHRMYLLSSDYQEPAKFMAALAIQNNEHSKEYTDFVWVNIGDLFTMVRKNLKVANQTNEKQYVLSVGNKTIFIHHPLMDMLRQAPVLTWLEALSTNQPVRQIRTQGSIGTIIPAIKRDPLPAFFDHRAEELEKIHHTMTKHLALMTEIKQKPLLIQTILPIQTASDAHLKWSLEQKGQPYVPGNDPQNIYLFLKHVGTVSSAYCEKCKPGTKKSDYQTALLDAMTEERKMKDWFVFYHALQGKMAFIYDIATEFRNFLRMMGSSDDPKSSIHSIRALDIFFKGLSNVEEFVKYQIQKQNIGSFLKLSNYENDYQEVGLSTNNYLFGNPRTDSSSTFDLLYDNISIDPPDYNKFLQHLLAQFGLNNTIKYFDLFNRHFGVTNESQLLQIFISPESVNDVVYLSNFGGHGIYDTYETQNTHLNPKDFLTVLRTNPENAVKLLPEKTDSQEIDLQHLQARIFLKPEVMTNPHMVQIRRYFKTNPKNNYLKEIRALVKEDLTHWLQAQSTLSPDTLENPAQTFPPLQKIQRHQQQTSGKLYETTITESQYGQFLNNNNSDGIKQILAQNPSFDLFKPIQSIDYKTSDTRPETYPISLIANSPKIIATFINEYLQPMLQWTKSVLKSSDPVKAKACLLSHVILIKQGIDCFEDAQTEAKLGMKSKSLETRNSALSLFETLFEKNVGFDTALESATLTSNYSSSYNLFKLLVKRNKFLTESIDASQLGVNHHNELAREAAIDLFEALFEKNLGFDEVLQKATSTRHSATAINLFKALIKKDKYIDKALIAAHQGMKSGDWEIQTTATNLFKALFDKNEGFNKAFHAVNTGITSLNETIRSGAIFLAFELFKKWKNHTESANFAITYLSSPYIDVQLCAIGIFTELVADDQSFDKAILAATKGTKSANAQTKVAALNLFKALAEKKQGLKEAEKIANQGLQSHDDAVKNASQILLATIAKQTV